MSPSKKRKLSGLSSLELQLTYDRLLSLQKSFIFEDIVSEDQSGTGQSFVDQIADTIAMLRSRLESPVAHTFSGATDDTLQRFGLTWRGKLVPREDYQHKVTQFTARGSKSLWSAENFHRQLSILQSQVARSTEACSRVWIDTFMFRAAAILEDKYVVLNLEHRIPAMFVGPDTLGGFIDYTAMASSDKDFAGSFLDKPSFHNFTGFNNLPGVFIVEAKVEKPEEHVAQVLCEMYASLKQLGKKSIRGAVTNGFIWVFLHLNLDGNDQGGQYYQSKSIHLVSGNNIDSTAYLQEDSADYIAAVLSSWMGDGLADFDPSVDGLLKIMQ